VAATNPKVPLEVHRLVFSRSEFARPVAITLPKEGDRAWLERLRTTRFGMSPLVLTQGFDQIDKRLLAYLIYQRWATAEAALMQSTGYPYRQEYTFLFYTENLARQQTVAKQPDGGFAMQVARRTLDSITYANQYQAAPLGVSIKVCALTFAYRLDRTLPGISIPMEKAYQGKAKAFLDPDDGQ